MKPQNPLIGTRPPTAPIELRAQVLEVMDSKPCGAEEDLWDRLWCSRRLRLSWLATLLVLLTLHAVVIPGDLKGIQHPARKDQVQRDSALDTPFDAAWVMKLSQGADVESAGPSNWVKLIEALETGS